MRINKQITNNKDWKAKVILGYVLIIALFCCAASWILFVTVPQAVRGVYEEELNSVSAVAQTELENITDSVEIKADACLKQLGENTAYAFYLFDQDEVLVARSDVQGTTKSETKLDQVAQVPQLHRSQLEESYQQNQTSAVGEIFNSFFNAVGSESLYKESEVILVSKTYYLLVEESGAEIGQSLTSIQVFGFGLLLVILLVASLISYWSYSAALNSIERTERALASFMANSSHEMKTPVASIKLLSESITIAANRGQMDYVKDFASRIEQATNHLEKLVRDMLSITRSTAPLKVKLSSGESSDAETSCCVLEVLSEALLVQESIAQSKGLSLVTDFKKSLKDVVVDLSDQDFLTIVNNLVSNAIYYTNTGVVTVDAEYLRDSLVLRVSDTGCGISSQDQDRIFERFYRVDSSRSDYAQGTGLGLPLVSSIVANAGGKINLESELGKGSTFTVVLPARILKSK